MRKRHILTSRQSGSEFIRQLYGIEREVKALSRERRLHERRTRAAPIASALHDWLIAQRIKIKNGTATAKAIDYSLNRWAALTRDLDDPALPIDNNHDEQQIRPWATGRKNWLFAGTLMAGKKDVLSRLSTLRLHLAARARWHADKVFADPSRWPLVHKVLCCFRPKHGTAQRRAGPLQLDFLETVSTGSSRLRHRRPSTAAGQRSFGAAATGRFCCC